MCALQLESGFGAGQHEAPAWSQTAAAQRSIFLMRQLYVYVIAICGGHSGLAKIH